MTTKSLRIRYIGDASQVWRELGRIETRHGSLGRALSGVGSLIKRGVQVGAVAVTGLAVATLAAGVSINSTLETATLQFKTLMGSASKARKHVKSLFDFAARTPFETAPIIEASRMLQTFGGSALNTEESLTLVGDAAAAVSAEINEVAFWVGRAYSAIQSGKPFGEAAMRLQELAVMSPKARDEMEQLQKEGATASEVWAVMEKDLGRFSGAMLDQAESWKGVTSTLSDVATLSAGEISRPLFGAFKNAGKALIGFSNSPAWDRLKTRATDSVGKVADAMNAIIKSFESGGFGAAMVRFRMELDEALLGIDFSGLLQRTAAKIDFVAFSARFVEGIVMALDRVDWARLSEHLIRGFVAMLTGIDWAALIERITPALVTAALAIIDGLVRGLIRAAIERPMDMLLLLVSLGFAPAKLVGALGAVLGRVPLVGPILKWLLGGFAFVGRLITAPIRKLLLAVGRRALAGLREGVGLGWLAVRLWFVGIPARIGAFFVNAGRYLLGAGRSILFGLLNGLLAAWRVVWAFLRSLPRRFLGAIPSPGSLLVGIGRSIISGLWSGMRSMWKTASSWVGKIGGFIKGLKGPLAKDRMLLFTEGRAIIEGLQSGMQSRLGDLARTVGEVSGIVSSPPALAAGRTRGSGGGTVVIQIDGHDLMRLLRGELLRKKKSLPNLGLE